MRTCVLLPRTTCGRSKGRHRVALRAAAEVFDGAAGAVATALTTVLEVVTATTVVDADGTTVEADSHQRSMRRSATRKVTVGPRPVPARRERR